MSIWVWPVTEESWPTVKTKNVWAVSTPETGTSENIGDNLEIWRL